MKQDWHRREIIKLLGVAGVTFASGLTACHPRDARSAQAASLMEGAQEDFFFLQLSDTHWGYEGPANPEAQHTLREAVRVINASPLSPRFAMFTGDLIQTTTDDAERDTRMRQFRDIVGDLRVAVVHAIPGEHDAAVDACAVYRDHFGTPYYSFDEGGVHFVALDNASDPTGGLGEAQLAWLRKDLTKVAPTTNIVVFAHRPLFALFPSWSWSTPDGDQALSVLSKHPNVTVFYGHIHQEHHTQTGHIQHHAARSLVFPLPAAGSVPTRGPLPWQIGAPDHGVGYRTVEVSRATYRLQDVSVIGGR